MSSIELFLKKKVILLQIRLKKITIYSSYSTKNFYLESSFSEILNKSVFTKN